MTHILLTLLATLTSQEGVSFEEKLLATIPEDVELKVVLFHPHGKSVALKVERGVWPNIETKVILDDKSGSWFRAVSYFQLSPDGKHLIYVALKRGKSFVVSGEETGEPYNRIKGLTFSPNGEHTAYAAKRRRKWYVVMNAEESAAFDSVGTPVWAPDRKTVAYSARSEGKEFIMVGKEKIKDYDRVWDPVFNLTGATWPIAQGAAPGNLSSWAEKRVKHLMRWGPLPSAEMEGGLRMRPRKTESGLWWWMASGTTPTLSIGCSSLFLVLTGRGLHTPEFKAARVGPDRGFPKAESSS